MGHQVSASSAPLSGASRPAKSFPINTYDPEKQSIHGHPQFINKTYIQSTVLHVHLLDELIYFLNITNLLIKSFNSQITNQIKRDVTGVLIAPLNLSIRKLD